MSNIKEVSRYCSPEVEYLMISIRPHYLPREFSSILFVAVYLPPQSEAGTKTTLNEMYKATTDAGTKTALNQLYKAISKQENPEAVLLVAGDFNAGKLMQANFYHIFTSISHVQPDWKKL